MSAPLGELATTSIANGSKLSVRNVASRTTFKELRDFFKGYGVYVAWQPVQEYCYLADAEGHSKIVRGAHVERPCGYVHVIASTPSEARRVVSELNGKKLKKRKITVQLACDIPEPSNANPSSSHPSSAAIPAWSTQATGFLGGLPTAPPDTSTFSFDFPAARSSIGSYGNVEQSHSLSADSMVSALPAKAVKSRAQTAQAVNSSEVKVELPTQAASSATSTNQTLFPAATPASSVSQNIKPEKKSKGKLKRSCPSPCSDVRKRFKDAPK